MARPAESLGFGLSLETHFMSWSAACFSRLFWFNKWFSVGLSIMAYASRPDTLTSMWCKATGRFSYLGVWRTLEHRLFGCTLPGLICSRFVFVADFLTLLRVAQAGWGSRVRTAVLACCTFLLCVALFWAHGTNSGFFWFVGSIVVCCSTVKQSCHVF